MQSVAPQNLGHWKFQRTESIFLRPRLLIKRLLPFLPWPENSRAWVRQWGRLWAERWAWRGGRDSFPPLLVSWSQVWVLCWVLESLQAHCWVLLGQWEAPRLVRHLKVRYSKD